MGVTKRRYPGLDYFTKDQASLFKGRPAEIEELSDLLLRDDKTLLYGKSGLGKTSLIYAGVIPELIRKHKLKDKSFLYFRFRNFIRKEVDSPVITFVNTVKQILSNRSDEIFSRLQGVKPNLWLILKEYRFSQGIPKDQPIYIILDQFEELASYPKSWINEFGNQISDIYYQRQPKKVERIIRNATIKDPTLSASLDEAGHYERLNSDLNAKILFSIRKDKLDFIKLFQDNYIPGLLDGDFSFELKPLSKEGAKKAIIEPAHADGKFLTDKFDFEEELVEEIVNTLDNPYSNNEIETFQVQLLCTHIEDRQADKNEQFVPLVSTAYFCDQAETVSDQIDKILNDHYEIELKKLSEIQQRISRYIIEDKLISPSGERRLSRDKEVIIGFIKERFMTIQESNESEAEILANELLSALENTWLIRPESNSLGGINYEISHDTLLNSIKKSKEIRERLEKQKKNALEEAKQFEIKGFQAFKAGNYDQASIEFGKAYSRLKNYPDEREILLRMTINRGTSASVLEKFTEAEEYFDEALVLSEQIKSPDLVGLVYESMGNSYDRSLRYRTDEDKIATEQKVLKLFLKAKACYAETDMPEGMARVLGCLAYKAQIKGDFESAKDYYLEAKGNLMAAGEFVEVDKIERQIELLRNEMKLAESKVPWGYIRDLRTQKVYDLEGVQPIQIGRNVGDYQSNKIPFPLQTISRKHIIIYHDGPTLEDQRSLNGTTVNSKVVPYGIPYSLQNKDVIVLANLIPLQFTKTKSDEDPAPLDYWAIYISPTFQKITYLVEDDYYLYIDEEYYLTVETEKRADPVLQIRRTNRGMAYYLFKSRWDLTSIYRYQHKYETYIIKREEFIPGITAPSQFAMVDDQNKIQSYGPRFQVILKEENLKPA